MGKENQKEMRYRIVIPLKVASFLFFLLLSSNIMLTSADRGMIPIIPEVSIYEPGQKAIIAWNGQEEILILSTDASSTYNTTTLEILPLPSNPKKIAEASLESFNVIQELIWLHTPPPSAFNFGETKRDIEVLFHEKIGMHDITVVEAGNVSEFVEWMDEFLIKNGMNQEVSLRDFESIIEDYMSRGFHFYVLDLVELSPDRKSVEPILYEFDTDFLYYPLLITSPIGGEGKILLFLLTEGLLEDGYYPLEKAYYHGLDFFQPIQFWVSNEELSTIDPSMAYLFEDKAILTVLRYEGSLDKLTEDMAITEIAPIVTGDLNFNGKVDIFDVITVTMAFGSRLGDSNWDLIADANNDDIVDIFDVVLVATNFGKTY